jgi:molecular chaperone HscB
VTEQSLLTTDLTQDYFALFGLTPAFDINIKALETRFREIQSASHPDRFVTASASEKRASMQLATLTNTAYQTLIKPDTRALYLLKLQNIEAVAETNTAMPADFLMQQMEWREAIEEAKSARNISALDDLLAEIRNVSKTLCDNITQHLDKERNACSAVDDVRKLVFIQKVSADINHVIEQLEDA